VGVTEAEFRDQIQSQFPANYWQLWNDEYGHDFFGLHFKRTYQYNLAFGSEIAGKSVLEIGGFPGLLASMYRLLKCKISTIESETWTRDFYKKWAKDNELDTHYHDIVKGAPEIEGHWDYAVMSDVLLHLYGFPSIFIRWVVNHADRFVLCWESGKKDGKLIPVESGSMRCVYPVPAQEDVVKEITGYGGLLERTIKTEFREILIFRSV
jgi:hypothetical protein